jgi:transglutaminase-like putative cysteine protease
VVSVAVTPVSVGLTRRAGSWRLTSALLLVLLATSFSLIGLIQGFGWWFLMLFVGSLILVAAAALRTLGVPRILVPLIEVAILTAILTVGFGRGTGFFGIIPTTATFERFGALGDLARTSIYAQGTPASPLVEFMFLIVLGTGVFSIILDTVAITFSRPGWAGLAIVPVLIVPAVLFTDGVSPIALAECAAAFLFLLRSDARKRHQGIPRLAAAFSIGAVSIVVALVISVTAPGFDRGGAASFSASGISIGGTVTPLIDLGRDLRRPAPVHVLSYTTTAPTPQYLKLTSLDQFTGTVWKHRERPMNRLPAVDTIGSPAGLSKGVATKKFETTVRIDNMNSRWLPVPYPVTSVNGLNGTWAWDPADLTIGAVNTSTVGQNYKATSLMISPTATQLKNDSSVVPASLLADLFVPQDIPVIITQTALDATAGATSKYEKAVALQDYFREQNYQYSVDTPLEQGYGGDGMAVIATFLQVKSGYCVHFASAMAIMARTLGIPARVSIGYLPGASSPGAFGSSAVYNVTSDDLHAWPELYFAGVGWVPFEPTVGRGIIPSYTRPDSALTLPTNPSGSGTAPSTRPLVPVDPTTTSSTSGSGGKSVIQPVVAGLGGGLVVAALLLMPAFLRRWRRKTRLRQLRDEWGGAAIAWSELIDTARDFRWHVSDTETPRAFAARVGDILSDLNRLDALDRLLLAIERESFGPPGRFHARGVADDLELVLAGLQEQAGNIGRLRAVLVPVSLVPMAWLPSSETRVANA